MQSSFSSISTQPPFERYYFCNIISFMRVIREDKVWALFHANDPNKRQNYMCALFILFSENLNVESNDKTLELTVKKVLCKSLTGEFCFNLFTFKSWFIKTKPLWKTRRKTINCVVFHGFGFCFRSWTTKSWYNNSLAMSCFDKQKLKGCGKSETFFVEVNEKKTSNERKMCRSGLISCVVLMIFYVAKYPGVNTYLIKRNDKRVKSWTIFKEIRKTLELELFFGENKI